MENNALKILNAVFAYSASQGHFSLPEIPERSAWEMLTIVAGTLIVVQGFETTRYLGESFDTLTRIRASRWSQYFSLSTTYCLLLWRSPSFRF